MEKSMTRFLFGYTDCIYMDFSLCPTAFLPNTNPTLGGPDPSTALCSESLPLGRLVLGLYGHLVPLTVSNFKRMCSPTTPSSYKATRTPSSIKSSRASSSSLSPTFSFSFLIEKKRKREHILMYSHVCPLLTFPFLHL